MIEELRPEVIKEIEEAREEIRKGRGIPLSKVLKELKLKSYEFRKIRKVYINQSTK